MTSFPTGGSGGALREMQHLFAEGTSTALSDGQLLERFLTRGDDAAFGALVQRHGRMVLGVCRSVLRNPADAEDAFQATFLVLVCKGRSIRGHEALGGWLRQVAHRVAVQAGADAVRRRTRERRAGAKREAETGASAGLDDWRQVLHEELAGLSEKHRLPLLLCDLEGKTHAQAAEELGCGPATIQRRLNVARARLRSRLIRRGVAPTAGMLAAGLDQAASASVPAGWVEATVRAAGSWGSRAGRLAAGHVAATSAAALASRSVRAMMLSQLRVGAAAAVFLAALAGVVWKAGLAAQDGAGRGAMPAMKKARAATAAPPVPAVEPGDPKDAVVYQGRVLDPDGKAFAKAAVSFLCYGLKLPENTPARATTGADGRFRFAVARSEFDESVDEPWRHGTVLAGAPGLGFGMAGVDREPGELTLHLVRDDVPIDGRVIDLQGRPVAGVSVSVFTVGATANGRLDEFLKAIQERNEVGRLLQEFFTQRLEDQPNPPLVQPVVTGADGRFRIKGIGRERLAALKIDGPTIETALVMALTRPGPTMRVPLNRLDGSMPTDQVERLTIYGASFDHVAGPTRPIEGVVSDLDTGRPLAGIMVHAENRLEAGLVGEHIRTLTDAQGRYRLVGLPQGQEGHVLAVPPCDYPLFDLHRGKLKVPPDESLPYLRARLAVGKVDEPGPAHLDIKLKRGVWLTGRVLDRETRQPVRGQVEYFVYTDNPHMEAYPAFGWTMIGPHFARADGVFHFVVFPGPGVLAARVGGSRYIRAAGLEKLENKVENGLLMTHPYNAAPTNFNVVDPIDPAPNAGSMTHDLLLESGRTLPVKVLDLDGQPVNPAELMTVGLRNMSWWQKVPSGRTELKIVGLGPGRGRTIEIRHEAKRLVGELILRGDETGPQTIRLQPWGVLTGRVVDAEGEPVGGGNIYPIARPAGYPEIGKDGRFRIDGILPGKSYDLQFLKDSSLLSGFIARGIKVGPGETRDLGDVRPGQ